MASQTACNPLAVFLYPNVRYSALLIPCDSFAAIDWCRTTEKAMPFFYCL